MSLFITATDTGVGKTLVTGGLAFALREQGLDIGCWKPLQSGELLDDPNGDALRLKTVGNLPDPVEAICLQAFQEPLAPRLSAERAGVQITRQDLLAHYAAAKKRHQHLLIEGAGGLAVPLTADTTVVELAQEISAPLLIIARPSLGTVNHTVLTVHYAHAHGLTVAGVILSGWLGGEDPGEAHNPVYMEEYAGVPVLGRVPWLGNSPTNEEIRHSVSATIDICRIAERLGSYSIT